MGSGSIHQRVYNDLGIRFTFLLVLFFLSILLLCSIAYSNCIFQVSAGLDSDSSKTLTVYWRRGKCQACVLWILDKRGLTRVMDQ